MRVVLASDRPAADLALPALEARAIARRAAPPIVLGGVAAAAILLFGGPARTFIDGMHRALGVKPSWAVLAAGFECISLAGYVGLLSLVAGRATPRIGARESAQITFAGAAATRLLPTAGVGGLGVTLWALRRAGLQRWVATRTLMVFLVLLYSAFLVSMALSGSLLATGVVRSRGPVELSATMACVGLVAVALGLWLALRAQKGAQPGGADRTRESDRGLRAAARLVGESVRDAGDLLRSRNRRLAGALAYWAFDAAVLWAMLHAFGASAALPVVVLAYFAGQIANTLPIPGSVSGGMAGVLLLFGVPAELAVPSVLAYRAVSVWLPAPLAIAAVPALRATAAGWRRLGPVDQPAEYAQIDLSVG
ncbi:MAG TPA: YbhN family protein [Solirubrobacteraceae bacterium]|nr:YbhN family protein [Solirubrobacteraceae bacterium]